MKVAIKQMPDAPPGKRHYIARNRKGETVEAKVHDSGHGFAIFWERVKNRWPKAYTA